MHGKKRTHLEGGHAASKRRATPRAAPTGRHAPRADAASAIRLATLVGPAALSPGDFLSLQRTLGNRAVQRMLAGRAAEFRPPRSAPHQSIGSGGPRRLPAELLAKMEGAFEADFSGVRLHADSAKATAVGAVAYTQGDEVHFAPGMFRPESREGQQLLGHELTHVVQQREGRAKGIAEVGGVPLNDDPQLEREADERGRRAAGHRPAAGPQPGLAPVPAAATGHPVQRKNSWYGNGPQYTTKESPFKVIADGLATDAGISRGYLNKHLQGNDELSIAKTARKNLTAGTNDIIWRPDKASAWLDTPNPNPGTRKDPSWITAYGNLGTLEDQIMGVTPQSYNGGHLIAWEFLNEAANVKGNIAPQALTQNQALFRRIERTLEETVSKHKTGVEVTVSTPYRFDNYTVSYRDLFARKVLTDPGIINALEQKSLLDKQLTFPQMAPDVYDVYFLTQTGVTHLATQDAREAREGITTYPLPDYSEQVSNKFIAQQKPPALSILATNLNPQTMDQDVAAFAHLVFLNYRTKPGSFEEETKKDVVGMELDEETKTNLNPTVGGVGAMDLVPQVSRAELVERARKVIQRYMMLAVPILQTLQHEFGLLPTQAENALVLALIESDPETLK